MNTQCSDSGHGDCHGHGAHVPSPTWVSGELLEFRSLRGLGTQGASDGHQVTFRALVECRGAGKFAFALPGHPYRRLRLSSGATGQPEWDPGPGGASGRAAGSRDCSWLVEDVQDVQHDQRSSCVRISITSKRERLYLAPAYQTSSREIEVSTLETGCLLQAHPEKVGWEASRAPLCAREDRLHSRPVNTLDADADADTNVDVPPPRGLSEHSLLSFIQNGYLVVRRAVPVEVQAAAKAYINGRLGALAATGASCNTHGLKLAPQVDVAETIDAELDGDTGEKADPAGVEHVRHPLQQAWGGSAWQLLALCRCAEVAGLLEELLGRGCVDPHFGAQVALRFPGIRDDLVAGGAAVRTRVSGVDWHTDGLRQGRKHPFTILIGVALSAMTEEGKGNLCVWPQSHYFTQKASRWPDGKFLRPGGWERTDGPLPDLGEPVQVLLQPGDIVLAHCELAHCGGPLVGPDIRYMVYFRIKHHRWQQMREAGCFTEDMWCDFEGIKRLTRPCGAETAAAVASASALP